MEKWRFSAGGGVVWPLRSPVCYPQLLLPCPRSDAVIYGHVNRSYFLTYLLGYGPVHYSIWIIYDFLSVCHCKCTSILYVFELFDVEEFVTLKRRLGFLFVFHCNWSYFVSFPRQSKIFVENRDFCRAMLCISAACAVIQCLCVCHVRELCRHE